MGGDCRALQCNHESTTMTAGARREEHEVFNALLHNDIVLLERTEKKRKPPWRPTAPYCILQVTYTNGPYEGRDGYAKLQEDMLAYERKASGDMGPTRRLFYLALPPSVYPPVCAELRKYCMNSRTCLRYTRTLSSGTVLHELPYEAFGAYSGTPEPLFWYSTEMEAFPLAQ